MSRLTAKAAPIVAIALVVGATAGLADRSVGDSSWLSEPLRMTVSTGKDGDSLPGSLKPPLKCADLATADVSVASCSGAHSYLQFGQQAGVPALRWRQFSDWGHGNLFDWVLMPRLAATPDAKVLRTGYRWRPDFVDIKSEIGKSLRVQARVAYVNDESIVAVLTLTNLTARRLRVDLVGRMGEGAQARVTAEDHDVSIAIDRPIRDFTKETPLRLDFVAVCAEADGSPSAEGRDYAWQVTLAAGERRRVAFALTMPGHVEELARWVSSPADAIAQTTAAVDHWLAQAAVPKLTDARRLRTYYRAWYQFWYSTEHPEGLWSRPIITPSKSAYGRGVWLWDSAFHIFALVTGGPEALQLAKDQVIVLVENGERLGHLPREVWVGEANRELQAPGVLTWAVLEIFQRTRDREFLERVYPMLGRNNVWWYQNKDVNGNGLCEWQRADSGWDTSPRFDRGEVDAVDLNCWLYLDQQMLARIATLLRKRDEAAQWRERSAQTRRLIQQHLWHDESGMFLDRLPDGEWITVKTPATYWTMMTGVATKAQAQRMVAYLRDPQVFATEWPIPCVAANEKTYAPNDYWRGPVWINLNWLTIRGLRAYHYDDLADWLEKKSLDVIAGEPFPREYYNPETGAGLGAQNYNWTGGLFIRMICDQQTRR
jgi:hypothetical protein